MAGDYSRFSFDPAKSFDAVLQQQGRVSLDSDWNEAEAIAERRRRTDSLDTFGRCVVPDTTPDAFLVTPTGIGDFSLGIGRAYVDGYQAECRGVDPQAFNATLAELVGTAPLDYATQQPFLPPPLPPPLTGTAGTSDLVYLDVWQREVTYLEDGDLLEVALGGPDTTTRMQTVWQVRVLTGVGNVGCADPVTAYDAATRPSAARLTTSAVAPPDPDDPCIIPPTGGYRGLENRLYRVEVHTPGPLGTARFKWSREAGSVVFGVESLAATRDSVILRSLGRDTRGLSVEPGDWVEILDDRIELALGSGHMAKVATVDPATREVTFQPAVPGTVDLDPTDAARHTRARRWDQRPVPDGDGLLEVNAGPAELEAGVRVEFGLDPAIAGGEFRAGDYWLFWARTATASVQVLTEAPPRGIHHHYCRLAVIHWGGDLAGTEVEDCRTHWPPEGGCCTIIVRPGESIQAAIDALPAEGGCVCLKTGRHEITAPIVIGRGNVSLHGESPGSEVIRRNGVTLLAIGGFGDVPSRIAVETIAFTCELERDADPAGSLALLVVSNGAVIRFTECRAAVSGTQAEIVGLQIYRGDDILVERCAFEDLLGGLWSLGDSRRITVLESLFAAPRFGDLQIGSFGIFLQSTSGPSRLAHNRINGYAFGIRTGISTRACLIEGNTIARGAALWDVPDGQKIPAIEVLGDDCVVRDNAMQLGHPLHAGVHLTGRRGRIGGNGVSSTLFQVGDVLPVGILVESAATGLPADQVEVTDNTLTGLMDGILVAGGSGITVLGNRVSTSTAQPLRIGIGVSNATQARVADNRIEAAQLGIVLTGGERNQVRGNQCNRCTIGIGLLQETRIDVSGNELFDNPAGGIAAYQLQIDAAFRDNRLRHCGYQAALSFGFGIFVFFSIAEIVVESCEILDTGLSPTGERIGRSVLGIVMQVVLSARVEANLVSYLDLAALNPQLEDRALVLAGYLSAAVGDRRVSFGSALVLGNKLLGAGQSALVEFLQVNINDNIDLRFEKVIFAQNHCVHNSLPRSDADRATVRFWGDDLIVSANHVKAVPGFDSMDFNGRTRVALIGNMTTGGFRALGSSVPAPPQNFNVLL